MALRFFILLQLIGVILSAQAQAPFDCANSLPHRAFDFWLGKWSVADASGKPQGQNTIRAIQSDCALEEHWISVRGGTGQSINYYHPGRGQWHQLWTDGGASIIDISGGMENGSMVLVGSIYYLAQSIEKEFRGKWTPLEDGRVRQLFEERDDTGEWKTWFEGYYTKIK